MFRPFAALLLAAWSGPVLAQAAAPTPSPTPIAPPSPMPVASPTPRPGPAPVRVALTTSAGRIVIELARAQAPITTANFLRYVDQKRLDGALFYRVVKVANNFGFVQFGVEGDPKRILPPIPHEPTTKTGLRHLDGTVSIARLAPGSARGEFTVSVGDQPSFDADPTKPGDNLGYAAFGKVVEGEAVIHTIFDAPVSPTRTSRGAFKGEMAAEPVKIITARRVPLSATSTLGSGSGGGLRAIPLTQSFVLFSASDEAG